MEWAFRRVIDLGYRDADCGSPNRLQGVLFASLVGLMGSFINYSTLLKQ